MRSPVAIPIEQAISIRREAEKEIAPFLKQAFDAHQRRLRDVYGLHLLPISRATPGQKFALSTGDSASRRPVLLIYESFGQFDEESMSLPGRLEERERLAVVNVVLDEPSAHSRQRLVEALTASLPPGDLGERLFLATVPIHEDLQAEAFESQWGERTADEVRLAQLWSHREMSRKAHRPAAGEPVGPFILHCSDREPTQMASLDEVFSAWIETDDAVLVWTPEAGPSSDDIEKQLASSWVDKPRVLWPYDRKYLDVSGQEMDRQPKTKASFDRLTATGRVVLFWSSGERGSPYRVRQITRPGRRLLLQTNNTDWLRGDLESDVSVVHVQNSETDPMIVVRLVQGYYPEYAASLLQAPAEAGSTDAIAKLTELLADRDPEEARKWRTRSAVTLCDRKEHESWRQGGDPVMESLR